MPKNLEICKRELNIKENLCDFYIPLSNTLCPISMLVSIIIYTIFAAEFSGEMLTISQLIIVVFLSIQFAIATPRENGGIMATIPLLLIQLGLSLDSVGLIVAASIFIINVSGVVSIIVRDCDLYDMSRTK